MNIENIYIRMSEKIRKQLGLPEGRERFSYYEVLRLKPQFKTSDLEKALVYSREQLEHLKYHPQLRDEAATVMALISEAGRVLGDERLRVQYDALLLGDHDHVQSREEEDFRGFVLAAAEGGSLSINQKKRLILYSESRGLARDRAWDALDEIPNGEENREAPIAMPPRLMSPIPAYMDTPAFDLLLKQSNPILNRIVFVTCSNCRVKMPISRLVCRCGALLRGKLICLASSTVFPIMAGECPECGQESKLLLELTQDDMPLVYETLEHLEKTGRYGQALVLCDDLANASVGDKALRERRDAIKQKAEEERNRGELEKGMDSIRAMASLGHWRDARAALLDMHSRQGLSEEGMALLFEASKLCYRQSLRRGWMFPLIGAGIFLAGGLLFYFGTGEGVTVMILSGLGICGASLLLILAGLVFLVRALLYRRTYERIWRRNARKTADSDKDKTPGTGATP